MKEKNIFNEDAKDSKMKLKKKKGKKIEINHLVVKVKEKYISNEDSKDKLKIEIMNLKEEI